MSWLNNIIQYFVGFFSYAEGSSPSRIPVEVIKFVAMVSEDDYTGAAVYLVACIEIHKNIVFNDIVLQARKFDVQISEMHKVIEAIMEIAKNRPAHATKQHLESEAKSISILQAATHYYV